MHIPAASTPPVCSFQAVAPSTLASPRQGAFILCRSGGEPAATRVIRDVAVIHLGLLLDRSASLNRGFALQALRLNAKKKRNA